MIMILNFRLLEFAAERFSFVQKKLSAMAGGGAVSFNQPVYLSEKEYGDRNYALVYFMVGCFSTLHVFSLSLWCDLQDCFCFSCLFSPMWVQKAHGVKGLKESSVTEALDFYVQLRASQCSIRTLSVIAATLANGGICPITNE